MIFDQVELRECLMYRISRKKVPLVVQREPTEVHLFSYSTAFERLLISRQGQLRGDCCMQSLVRDA